MEPLCLSADFDTSQILRNIIEAESGYLAEVIRPKFAPNEPLADQLDGKAICALLDYFADELACFICEADHHGFGPLAVEISPSEFVTDANVFILVSKLQPLLPSNCTAHLVWQGDKGALKLIELCHPSFSA